MINQYLSLEQEQREIKANNNTDDREKHLPKVASIVPNKTEKTQVLLETRSKIKYNFRQPHPLLRFVTEETVAFLFAIDVEQIYRIECWQHVVYIHAEGVSRFVSYGDFPPVITAEKPDRRDFIYWRKRWVKKFKRIIAPEFWVKFYTQKFIEARSQEELREWGELIAILNFVFKNTNIERLRENYAYQRFLKLNKNKSKVKY